MIAINQKFADITIFLDGSTFVGCTFESCKLVFCGTLPFVFSNNATVDCGWESAGAASSVIELLASLYRHGGDAVVESIFDAIRGGGGPSGHIN